MTDAIVRDLRFASRGLRRSPGFTAAAIVTLALGIGATAAVFSVVYGVVLRPLPFPNADRLVQVVQVLPQRPGQNERPRAGLTADQVTEWRATSRTLAEIGYYGQTSLALTDVDTPVRLNGATVSVTLFRGLGVAPLKGRIFVEEDELPGNEHVVILSHSTWARRFGSSMDVLEKPVTLGGRMYRVIGVMPEGFGFPSMASPFMSLNSAGELADAPEFWLPNVARPRPASPARGGMTLVPTLALLRPDVTLQEATAEVNSLMPARVGERYPVELVSARAEQARGVRQACCCSRQRCCSSCSSRAATSSTCLLLPAACRAIPGRDVRYEPTPMPVVRAMLELAAVGPGDVVYDLGSGDGRIVIAAAKDFGARGVGIEIDPALVALAQANAREAGVAGRVEFRVGDMYAADISPATVVTLFLHPKPNLKLRPTLRTELRSGARVVSYMWEMGDWTPDEVRRVGRRRIYLWRR